MRRGNGLQRASSMPRHTHVHQYILGPYQAFRAVLDCEDCNAECAALAEHYRTEPEKSPEWVKHLLDWLAANPPLPRTDP